MSKIITFLLTIGVVFFCSFSAQAQVPTIDILPSDITVNPGDTITVNVTVQDFTTVTGLEGTISWDASKIDFLDIPVASINLPGMTPPNCGGPVCSFNDQFAPTGDLTFAWFNFSGVTRADNSIIWSMRFIAQSGGVTDIAFTDDYVTFMVTVDVTSSIPNSTPSTVTITGATDPCALFSGLTLYAENDSAATGQQVCVDVSACSFNAITSMSYTLEFDPTLMQFSSISNINLPQLSTGNFNTNLAGNGLIPCSWFDSTGMGVTFPDAQPLYSICFNLVGPGGSTDTLKFTDSLTNVSASDATLMQIPLSTQNGVVKITGASTGAVTVSVESASVIEGGNTCLDVRVSNFVDMLSLDYTMTWDPAILSFTQILDPNNFFMGALAGSVNSTPALTNNGNITVNWLAPNLGTTPQTHPNDYIIYQICFDAIGAGGSNSDVSITSDLTPMDAVRDDGMGGQASVPVVPENGNVNILGSGIFTFNTTSEDVCPGDTVCVQYLAQGFNNITTVNFTLTWDPALMVFDHATNLALVAGGSNILGINESKKTEGHVGLVYIYLDNLSTGLTIAQNTPVYEFCFIATGAAGSMVPFSFTDDPTVTSVGDVNGQINTYQVNPGTVTITNSACVTGPAATGVVTHVACNGGSTGAIDLTVTGGTTAYTYLWNDTGASTTQDISGLPAGMYSVTVTDAMSMTTTASFTINEPTALALTASRTNVSCNGGSDGAVNLTVNGGTSPYTYLWDDAGASTTQDIAGLPAGTYCVTVTDAKGCTESICRNVTQPTAIALSATHTAAACGGSDGTVDLTVSGGTAPYTYLWDDTAASTTEDISGLAAGTYCVTVTDSKSCTATICEIVTEAAPFTLSAVVTDASCNGATNGSIDLTVNGGASPFTYSWDNGAGTNEDPSGLAANTYCVTVTDANGCTATTCEIVAEGSPFTLSAVATDASCNGDANGSIDLTVTGATGTITYAWDNGAGTAEDPSGLAANTYAVTVTANGCTVTGSFMVGQPTILAASAVATAVTCNAAANGSIDLTVTGGTSPYTYSWDNGAGTNEDPSGLGPNTYCVTVTDSKGCTATTCTMITEPTAITISGSVTNQTTAGVNNGAVDITVSGGAGGYTYSWTGPSFTASTEDISALAPGTYSVTVTDTDGCTQTAMFSVAAADAPAINSAIITNALCNGGSSGGVDITVGGGTTPYTYLWNNIPASTTQDLVNVPVGAYSVTVTDANSVTIVGGPYVVGQAAPLTLSETHLDVSCNGLFDGEIHLTPGGGTAPYTVTWSQPVLNGPNLVGLAPGTYTPTITDANGCSMAGNPITINEPTAVVININQVTDVTCNGDTDGAINIGVSGGTSPYTYDWSNGGTTQDLNGIAAGNYKPTVTDARGCTATIPAITVSQPDAISGNPVVTHIQCNGMANGSIDLTPTGGSGVYSYNWGFANTQDVTNLGSGTYFVTINDDKGCSKVEGPLQIIEPAAINISEALTSPSITNDDGIINLTVTGGTSPFTYVWTGQGSPHPNSNLLTNLASGRYNVTVTDARGCTAAETYLLTGNYSANGQAYDADCAGTATGRIELDAQGGIPPYLYTWNTGATSEDLLNVLPGVYTVTVTDAVGSIIIESYTVGGPSAIVITIAGVIHESGNGCNGSINVSVSGGKPPYSYVWSNGATSRNLANLCKGNYILDVTDSRGCFQSSDVITILASPMSIANVIKTNTTCADSEDGKLCIEWFGGCEPYLITLSNGQSQTSLDGSVCFEDLPAGNFTGNIFDNQGSAISFNGTIGSPAPIAVTLDNIVPNTAASGQACNGAINVSVSGGTPPYTYVWSNGATSEDVAGLCASLNPYSVTITDSKGCIMSMGGFEIQDLPRIAVELTVITDESCYEECDGRINITVTGGLPPFTYIWSNGPTTQDIANLCPGNYDVTVTDANGTTQVENYEIYGPSEPLSETGTVTADQGGNNGQILLTIVGGVPPYTYNWSNGAVSNPVIGLPAGVYNFSVMDANGCTIVGSYQVTSNVLRGTFTPTVPTCSGEDNGCLEVFPTGGTPPYTFAWSNGMNGKRICGISGGTYSVTVTDALGLSAVLESFLTNPSPISVIIEDIGNGVAEAIVSGGAAPYTYAWNDANGSETAQVSGLNPGTYGVLVIDDQGCSGEGSIDIRAEGDCTDVRKVVTPNQDGKNDEFIIICAYEYLDNSLEVYDRYGQMVYRTDNYNNTWEGTDLSNESLPEGGYFWVFKYRDAEGRLETVKGHLTIVR